MKVISESSNKMFFEYQKLKYRGKGEILNFIDKLKTLTKEFI